MSTAEQQRRWRANSGKHSGSYGPKPSAACETTSGYKGHKRRSEPRCDACWAAWATYQRERYAARRTKRETT